MWCYLKVSSTATIIACSVLLSGCVWGIDWHGVWFGCHKGQYVKPARYSMFGTVKEPSQCVDEAEVARYDPYHVSHLGHNITECRKLNPQGPIDVCVEKKSMGVVK